MVWQYYTSKLVFSVENIIFFIQTCNILCLVNSRFYNILHSNIEKRWKRKIDRLFTENSKNMYRMFRGSWFYISCNKVIPSQRLFDEIDTRNPRACSHTYKNSKIYITLKIIILCLFPLNKCVTVFQIISYVQSHPQRYNRGERSYVGGRKLRHGSREGRREERRRKAGEKKS